MDVYLLFSLSYKFYFKIIEKQIWLCDNDLKHLIELPSLILTRIKWISAILEINLQEFAATFETFTSLSISNYPVIYANIFLLEAPKSATAALGSNLLM